MGKVHDEPGHGDQGVIDTYMPNGAGTRTAQAPPHHIHTAPVPTRGHMASNNWWNQRSENDGALDFNLYPIIK